MAPSYCCWFISSSAFWSSPCSSFVFTPASAPVGPAPGARTMSTGGFGAPMVRIGTLPPLGEKPGADAVIFHVPDRRPMIEKRPLSSVVAVNDEGDDAGFSATTVAPLIGCPFSSLTVPPTRPVWAAAGSALTISAATKTAAVSSFLASRIACFSLKCPTGLTLC